MVSTRLKYIEPSLVLVRRREDALHLDLKIGEGEWQENITLRRAFPLSRPNEYLSVLDHEEKEIGVILTLESMDKGSAELIQEELDRRYFTPQIQRIHSLKEDAGMWKFVVDTQRGPSEFFVRNWRDNAYEIVPNRWQITSVDGGRYEIVNVELLDQASQRTFEQLL